MPSLATFTESFFISSLSHNISSQYKVNKTNKVPALIKLTTVYGGQADINNIFSLKKDRE